MKILTCARENSLVRLFQLEYLRYASEIVDSYGNETKFCSKHFLECFFLFQYEYSM